MFLGDFHVIDKGTEGREGDFQDSVLIIYVGVQREDIALG